MTTTPSLALGMRVYVKHEGPGTVSELYEDSVLVRVDIDGTVVAAAPQQVTPLPDPLAETIHRGDHPHVFTNGTCVCGYTLTDRAYRDTHRDELATAIAGIDASRFPIMRTEREVTFVTETGFTIDGWIGTRTLQRVCSAVLTWAALVIALELRHTAKLRAIDGADSPAGFVDPLPADDATDAARLAWADRVADDYAGVHNY